jgi:hypothetical protein
MRTEARRATLTMKYAKEYRGAGINVLPIRPDGSKSPAIDSWNELKGPKGRMATDEELSRWFRNGNGLAAIGGAISRNLEDYDFDDASSFALWRQLIIEHLGQALWDQLLIVRTPRPGYAVITRCPSGVGSSQKLAWAKNSKFGEPGEPEYITLTETKGEGGYFLLPGCPRACHVTGRTYDIIQGTFDSIPELTTEEREVFLSCARSLDEKPREEYREQHHRTRAASEVLPGEAYNTNETPWGDILTPHGYKFNSTREDTSYWTRPGKEYGISASTNHNGSDLFYPFSTNCYPFDPRRGYSKFAVYTFLNHNGDFQASARELHRQGHGSRNSSGPSSPSSKADNANNPGEVESPPHPGKLTVVNAQELLTMQIPPREHILEPIVLTQSTNMLFSKRGVGKTLMSLGIASAVAAGAAFLRWRVPKPRKVLYVDGEMPAVAMQQRFASIVDGMDGEISAPSYFRLITPDLQADPMPSLSGTMGQRLIEDQIEDSEFIILDNISTLTTAGKENEAESWLPIQQWVLSLRRRGISVLLIHHAGRNGEQRGTSRREDVLDTMITLRHPEDYTPTDGARFQVHFTKARNSDGTDVEPFEVQMRTENGAAIWTMSSIEDAIQAQVFNLLDEGLSIREIAEELHIHRSKVERIKKGRQG